MIKKRIIIILCIAAALAVLCLIPFRVTRSTTLRAVKVDVTGKELGTVEIPVKYTEFRSLFSHRLHQVSIGDFDGYPGHEFTIQPDSQNPFTDYWETTVAVVNMDFDLPTPDNPAFDSLETSSFQYTLKVSRDLRQWYIGVAPFHYVASIPADQTPAELLRYFDIIN